MRQARQRKRPSQDDLLAQAARAFGSLGGKARKKALTPERRREIAQKAIKARWAKRRKQRKSPRGSA